MEQQLDFEPVKSKGQFLKNYQKHDIALSIVKTYLQQNHFRIVEYGTDKRKKHVWGDNRPDLLAWRNGYWLVLIDCKGHSGDTWMLNKRAYEAYLGYSIHYQIPVICIWVNLTTGYIYYAEIPFVNPTTEFMPHDHNKVVKTKTALRINNLMGRLRMQNAIDVPIKDQPQ